MSAREAAKQWLACAEPAVVVRVARAQGSVPREAGTRMLVSARQVMGTIGGGHLEWRAIERARRLLATPGLPNDEEHVALGPALGQCCGGAVTLAYERLDASVLAAWPDAALLFRLQLYGAGHVGRAIVRALAPLRVQVDWIDEREDEFPAEPLPGQPWPAWLSRVAVDEVQAEVDQAGPGHFYLVLTHSHDLDLRITEAIARRGDFAYLGLIGSATKRARFMNRLAERGLAPDVLARITCPIGVPGIDGKEPEVIAAAVVAQLLQVARA
ncbi:xanthine dehydrogenase accessory protein XdhC [Burkholderiales bacterium JOSHI_001]|nr:xanthine dehydrogenase accessory protein XdhC [Burkholderiales bacterium JOSHI_001]